MGEIKSVKVDNWGVFFLQKLQNFFNKTDYCDMTLQFRDNSQLKVHRLVLSACTDYFNLLEESCDIVEGAVIMPNELQADVVVPIVNFMYTGTLEFELRMYGKLLRTAKEMNMTVLLKLLEAHRRTMEGVNRAQRPPSPKAVRRKLPAITGPALSPQQLVSAQANQQQRRMITLGSPPSTSTVQQQRRSAVQTKTIITNAAGQVVQYRQQIGSTSVVRTSPLKGNQISTVTYITSGKHPIKHQIKQEPELDIPQQVSQATSPFEQLRKGYNNTKRPPSTTAFSPPAKKPNLEDVKEFAEQQRMRKQIAAEFGDDQEFDGMLDDDIHNDDDDDEILVPLYSANTSGGSAAGQMQTTRQRQDAGTTTITVKQEPGEATPTITVKDSSNAKLNHAKIIQEVIKQYPHLTRGNKSIKLKILPSSAPKVNIKQEQEKEEKSPRHQAMQAIKKTSLPPQITIKPVERRSAAQQSLQTAPTSNKEPAQSSGQEASNATQQTLPQKRRIDSKTMHALIALGAENTEGPWLCLRCGVNGKPISIPSYRGFRRHLINTHKETIDPALCEHCGWRSKNNRELHYHTQLEHNIKTTLYTFPQCSVCNDVLIDTSALNEHMVGSHPEESKQACEYCKKIFRDSELYKHIRDYHKKQAISDGIMDVEDDGASHDEESKSAKAKGVQSQVNIISDIALPNVNTTRFVTADGSEMVLTDDQRKEIMDQLNQHQQVTGGVVMVLNDEVNINPEAASSEEDDQMDKEVPEEQGLSESQEEVDDSEIYNEFLTQARSVDNADDKDTEKNSALNESKDSTDNLEWAENLISSQDSEVASANGARVEESGKKDQEDNDKKVIICKKVQELSCEWSEEEDDNDMDASESEAKKSNEADVEAEVNNTEEEDAAGLTLKTDKGSELEEENSESSKKKKEPRDDANDDDDVALALKSLHESIGEEEKQSDQEEEDDEKEANDESINDDSQSKKLNESNVTEEEEERANDTSIEQPTEGEETELEEEQPEQDAEGESRENLKVNKVPSASLTDEGDEEQAEAEALATVVQVPEELIPSEADIQKDDVLDELLKENNEEAEDLLDKADGSSNNGNLADNPCKEEEEFQDIDRDEVRSSATESKPDSKQSEKTSVSNSSIGASQVESQGIAPEQVKSLISDWGDDDDEEMDTSGIGDD